MDGHHNRFRAGERRGPPQPPRPQNPYFQNPNFIYRNPTQRPIKDVERIDRVVEKVRGKLVEGGEHVSTWKVSQAALAAVNAQSWESVGVPMQQVPSLHRLILTEGKINAFIHCFIAVRRITSLHDLDLAICKNEGVEQYEELELGPLVKHPLAMHYFSVNSNTKEIFHITSAEINSYLCEFIDIHKGSGISIDEFLDFAAKKKSVSGREKLCVRIQSMGMHITFIRQAKRLENDTLKKCFKDVKQNSSKGFRKRPRMSSQKRQLDEHFDSISKRIESFSFVNKDFGATGKHLRFISSSSEENYSEESDEEINDRLENYDTPCNKLSENVGSSNQSSGCPYPSLAEERSRLGLMREEVEIDPSSAQEVLKRKRKPENICGNGNISARRKLAKTDKVVPDITTKSKRNCINRSEADFSLDGDSLRMFIMMWKEACRVNSVAEVFWRMLEFYKIHIPRKKLKWFSSHPLIGLLNVAVISIARGMWDSLYDDFQDFSHHGVPDTEPENCTIYESIEVEPAEKDRLGVTKHDIKHVTVDDILQKVFTYFELDHNFLSNVELMLENKLNFLRKLCKCEFWLAKQFSVEKFKCLGYGKFFIFLEKNVPMLHNALQKCLTGDTFKKPSLEVCLFEDQLALFLSQAANNCGEDKFFTKDMILSLLTRQFPLVNFVLAERDLNENVMKDMKKNGSISTCVLFSATLLGKNKEDTVKETSSIGSITPIDAIRVLLKAPMLSDLISYTHWDVVFEPSFGPLLRWLLHGVNTKELLCLVTKDGKIIRIDHKSSIDSFFEACLQGSSFQTAVELLSLLSLYGGEAHVPLSLLKCHARQAFELILKNSEIIVKDNNTDGINIKVASRFFIDCLCHLPGEFHAFAADVLLSGLQSILKNAPSVILNECKRIDQRQLLHDIGLFLGIVEWIDDYHSFFSSMANDSLIDIVNSANTKDELSELRLAECTTSGSAEFDTDQREYDSKECKRVSHSLNEEIYGGQVNMHEKKNQALMVIESIRREEFGLDSGLSDMEAGMLKRQHARLGRALHCLSQELYSQDSHFLLELIQNADDNIYPENVKPTLTFILQESGIVILNNEKGFSSQNIRALCDVGSSTKKGMSGGYIGKKGIGFKSVFRVTDAPEIHSNGFHIKFDITDGQIGFVLPTVIPACDINLYSELLSCDTDNTEPSCSNTCIVLPFRTKLSRDSSTNSIRLMFCDLHPSLLLFLHRLKCIRFRSTLDDTMVIMTKQLLGDGIVNVFYGREKMTFFVASQVVQADAIRPDVKTTEISIAFTLHESGNGEYVPLLEQQPVFAFLPLRKYGLKFIIQGDFVLPSSREEVDADSPWNQVLLAKFPDLFVNVEKSFSAFPCFRDIPGKGVSYFLSFVPLVGEVQGFFSSLPRLIISKLRISKCLLMEGEKDNWVLPCKVLRNWDKEALNLLPGSFLRKHLDLGFLDGNIVLSDNLARDLGIQEYGPSILVQVISSLCHSEKGIKSVGLIWLSSCLTTLYTMLFNSSGQISSSSGTPSDVINSLRKIPFIPLSGGAYSSVEDGTVWLHSNSSSLGIANEYNPDNFPFLNAKLKTVSATLFSAAKTADVPGSGVSIVENVMRLLLRIGVQQLSDHEIMKVHVLPAISNDRVTLDDKETMFEYLSFVMCHLQSSCINCNAEREHIFSELRNRAFVLTNYGYKRPAEVPIHFGVEFGNKMDVNKLINGMDLKWHEVGVEYLQYPRTGSLPSGMKQWREFFRQLGITDFIQVVSVEKNLLDLSNADINNILTDREKIPNSVVVNDWGSQELVHILTQLSLRKDRIKSQYLLEALDNFWEEYFSNKVAGSMSDNSAGDSRVFKSSFINCLCGIQWVASTTDDELHFAKELFYDCENVRSIFGGNAPYAVPKLKSDKLLFDIEFKTQVSLDDVLSVLRAWRRSEKPFMASTAQMSKIYTIIWNEMATSKQKIMNELQLGPFIFCPNSWGSKHDDVALGLLVSPSQVHWHDFTGSIMQIKKTHHHNNHTETDIPFCKTLSNIYPSLHSFFVNECGVNETPPHRSYLQILLELSAVALPSQSAKTVFQVFLQWSDGLISGLMNSDDVLYLKECLKKLEFTVLPTLLDKWISLHPSFGLVCWCNDNKLRKEFKVLDNIEFLYFGELSDDEQDLLHSKVSVVMQTLGIPSLSEVVTHEAIYYGMIDCSFKTSLLNWAVPYAQRYIYKDHQDRYLELKQSGFELLSKLRVIVVDKLFSRNIVKGTNIASTKRRECKCLLQENLFYTTQESDTHSLFLEFSHLLVGVPDLHLANFLHMITTMVESGSNEDKIENFILNSQKIPMLPDSEIIWSLASPSFTENDDTLQSTHGSINIIDPTPINPKKKYGTGVSWPPSDWKNAPGFSFSFSTGMRMQYPVDPTDSITAETVHVPSEIGTSCNDIDTEQCDSGLVTAKVVLPDFQELEDKSKVVDHFDLVKEIDGPKFRLFSPSARVDLSHATPNPRALLTGRMGEHVAYNYFKGISGNKNVTWINEDSESGLPYDLVIEDEQKGDEYVEVKATKSSNKDWFHITLREWQFALEKGEDFTIAHVILSDNVVAKITMFKNPVKLCQLGKLHLAVLMPKP